MNNIYHVFANVVFKWVNSKETLTISNLNEYYEPCGFDGLEIHKFNFIILKEIELVTEPHTNKIYKYVDKNGLKYSSFKYENHIARSEKQNVFEDGWCLASKLLKDMEFYKNESVINLRIHEFKSIYEQLQQKISKTTND